MAYVISDECTACGQCANICPANCIYLASARREKGEEIPKASNGTPIRLKLKQYKIDMAVCCYCGLCTTVCPTECLNHTTDYEYSFYSNLWQVHCIVYGSHASPCTTSCRQQNLEMRHKNQTHYPSM